MEERELTIREACVELFEFKEKTKDRDEFYSFKLEVMDKDNPLYPIYDKISDAMQKIDTGEDFLYNTTVSCLRWLNENKDKTIDELRDSISEQADAEVDVYNSNLIIWFSESLNNIAYVDEAVEEMGYDKEQGIIGMLTAGQYACIEDIYREIMDAVEELEEESEEEND